MAARWPWRRWPWRAPSACAASRRRLRLRCLHASGCQRGQPHLRAREAREYIRRPLTTTHCSWLRRRRLPAPCVARTGGTATTGEEQQGGEGAGAGRRAQGEGALHWKMIKQIELFDTYLSLRRPASCTQRVQTRHSVIRRWMYLKKSVVLPSGGGTAAGGPKCKVAAPNTLGPQSFLHYVANSSWLLPSHKKTARSEDARRLLKRLRRWLGGARFIRARICRRCTPQP